MMFTEIQEALDWLYQQKKLKRREDLSRIKQCITLLKIQTNYKKIHIAGTNGKGSTANYLKKMLELTGQKVGFFVSPFVLSFAERIQINDTFIKENDIIHYCNFLKPFAEHYAATYHDTIPFFELTFLMALLYFDAQKIDIAIIECGLGGRFDATNCLDTDVQIITNIGFDHMQQLGKTKEEIAWHKLGITRPQKPCFTAVEDNLKSYFLDYGTKENIDFQFVYSDVSNIEGAEQYLTFQYQKKFYRTILKGTYQAYNASLAIAVIRYLDKNYPDEWIDQALMSAFWPGRFEEILPGVLLDGAHNIPAMEALLKSVLHVYGNRTYRIVFTALHDKAIAEMIDILDQLKGCYYFTTISDKRATDIEDFTAYTKKAYQLFLDYKQAISKAIQDKKENEIVLITGSLHFISEARKYLKEEF